MKNMKKIYQKLALTGVLGSAASFCRLRGSKGDFCR